MGDKFKGAGDWLKPITSAPKSIDFLVCDIESKDGDSQEPGFTRPFLTGVYDGARKSFHPFYDKPDTRAFHPWEEAFWRPGGNVDRAMRFMLQKRYRGMHIYAHNAGSFDYLFFLPWLRRIGKGLGYNYNVLPVSSSIQMIDVWHGQNKKKWRFVDSLKLIPMGLDRAAKTFGLEGKLAHDLHMHEDRRKEWNEYNEVDCVQLYNVLSKFHHMIEHDLGGEVGITAPSTAMKLFRRKYLPNKIPRSVNTHEFVRQGYFGGRVEVYEQSAQNLHYYDINSSYPASMKKPMPIGPGFEWTGEPPKRFTEGGFIGFCECDVLVPEDLHIPPLPVKCPKTGKLLFPVGKLSGVWAWSELQQAISMGSRIVNYHQSVWYESGELFGKYVDDIYQLRNKSLPGYDSGLDAVAKIMLNALYGKFGMQTLRKRYYCWDDPKMPENARPAGDDPEAGIWIAEEPADACYVMPHISACVTALSRGVLLRGMLEVTGQRGRVAYTDTDSMLSTVTVKTSTDLGAWKDEYPEHSGRIIGEFIAPKVYLLSAEDSDWDFVKAKGVRRATRDQVEFMRDGGTIHQDRLEKVGTLARYADFMRGPQIKQVPRRILGGNTKRQVNSDGSTTPFKFNMW